MKPFMVVFQTKSMWDLCYFALHSEPFKPFSINKDIYVPPQTLLVVNNNNLNYISARKTCCFSNSALPNACPHCIDECLHQDQQRTVHSGHLGLFRDCCKHQWLYSKYDSTPTLWSISNHVLALWHTGQSFGLLESDSRVTALSSTIECWARKL